MQRVGDVVSIKILPDVRKFAKALAALANINRSTNIAWRDPVLPTERIRHEAITAGDLGRLGTSIMEVEGAEH